MNKYIVITEFGIEHLCFQVAQFDCQNWGDLLILWAQSLKYPRIGEKSRERIVQEITDPDDCHFLLPINGTHKIISYTYFVVNGIFIGVYALKIQKQESFKYAMIASFKGASISYVLKENSLQNCLVHWSRYLSWRYFSREERAAIRKAVSEMPSLNMVIEGLVWKFESSILGNKLEVYIVELGEAS